MATLHATLLLSIATASAAFGCSSAPTEPPSRPGKAASAVIASINVETIQLIAPNRSDPDIIKRAHEVLNSLGGTKSVADPTVLDRRIADEFAENGTAIHTNILRMVAPGAPRTLIVYSSGSDSIDARNNGIVSTHRHDSSDVTEDQARAIATSAFDALSFSATSGRARIDFAEAVVRPIRAVQASSDGSSNDSWIEQYQLFAPLRVNGIAVRQGDRDLGAVIRVHRTGMISRIAIDGVGVASNEAGAFAVGGTTGTALQSADAQAEASIGFPNPVVESLGLRYVFPVGGNIAPAAPRQVYRVHSNILQAGVATCRTKAVVLSYRVDSATPVREVFPVPGTPSLASDIR